MLFDEPGIVVVVVFLTVVTVVALVVVSDDLAVVIVVFAFVVVFAVTEITGITGAGIDVSGGGTVVSSDISVISAEVTIVVAERDVSGLETVPSVSLAISSPVLMLRSAISLSVAADGRRERSRCLTVSPFLSLTYSEESRVPLIITLSPATNDSSLPVSTPDAVRSLVETTPFVTSTSV